MLSREDMLALRAKAKVTTYPRRHSGTLIVVGAAADAVTDFATVASERGNYQIAAIGHAAALMPVDFVVSDHYEIHEALRRLQSRFGSRFTTHCTLCRYGHLYPSVDYWWSWRRALATSAETAIRMGLYVGFDEIVLCGCPLERAKVQPTAQVERDGEEWPPPRDVDRYGEKDNQNTSDEILREFRRQFEVLSEPWRDRVFSVSGFTRQVLGLPPGVNGVPRDARSEVRRWQGKWGCAHAYPGKHGRWPDEDAVNILREVCCGVVCDVGCGTGRCAEAFPPDRYVWVDVNPAAIEQARKEFPQHEFRVIGADEAYPRADTYLFYTVLLHVPDSNLLRVLSRTKLSDGSPSRVVIFETMNPKYRDEKRGIFNRAPIEYAKATAIFGKREIELRRLPSAAPPHERHFYVAEEVS